jgi:hypothetical protein
VRGLSAFTLPDTDGEEHTVAPGERPACVIVTCNHCPYALAWHDRLLAVAADYRDRVEIVFVNPNDAERYPRDSFEAMRARVEREGPWAAPYLRDEDQAVAGALGARTTPDCFVWSADGEPVYRGAPDADYGDPAQGAAWLRGALDAALAGTPADPERTEPIGCSVKWREGTLPPAA